jgi:hypothetical protein
MLGDGRLKPFLIELVENIFTAENQCHRAEREKSTAENHGFKIGRGAQKEKNTPKKVRVEATIYLKNVLTLRCCIHNRGCSKH